MRFGCWRSQGNSPFGLKWVLKIKILGVYFSNGLLSVESDNWKSKLDKLETVLNLWKQRELSFIGRAMIVNVLGANRFWHVAKILHPPRWVCDRFHRLIWLFIWKVRMENVSRQRCCTPLKMGGLNVVDFRTKCVSLRLSCLSSMCDSCGSEKWHFLAHYFLGPHLAKLDARFSFSYNSVPVSPEPSFFYRLCLLVLQSLFDRNGSLPDDFSSKNIYSLLYAFPDSAPRCAGYWGAVVGHPINPWASVWRKSRLKFTENKKCDLIWLLLHDAVRVRYNLRAWAYIDTDLCAVCSQPETAKHCFIDCRRAARVWNYFSAPFSRFLGFPFALSFSSVLFPFFICSFSPGLSVFY